jgi:hypothetical protein
LGRKVVTLKKHPISLRQEARGLTLPSLSLRRGMVPDLGWASDIPLSSSSLANVEIILGRDRKPSSSLYLTQSLLGGKSAGLPSPPRSELKEPFGFGYLDNVNVESPAEERERVGRRRLSLSVGTVQSGRVVTSELREPVSKPWEIVLEGGGRLGGTSVFGHARSHSIRPASGELQQRIVLDLTALPPFVRIAEGLYGAARIDGRYYANDGPDHRWIHAQLGLVWRASPKLRVGAAWNVGAQSGMPAIAVDRLDPERWAALRADWSSGPTDLSLLAKYDPKAGKWVDFEVALRQVAGCVAPFVVYRQSPRTLNIGLELRALTALDRLKSAPARRDRNNRPLPQSGRHDWLP